MKWLDLPPVWLMICLILAWSVPARFDPGMLAVLGWVSIGLAMVLTGLAVLAFRTARTTIIPRQAPSALITSGIFSRTRNPIYLADVLILFGFSLYLGSPTGLLLVPVFAVFLDRRFIRGEEAVMHQQFGAAFETYRDRVRRWL